MYSECLSCPKLGVSCDGPNFVAMSSHDLVEWCKARKARLGLSNAKLAELSGVPKGTIDRVLSGENVDYKHETIRLVIKALVGGDFSGTTCNTPDANEIERLTEAIAQKNHTIALLEEENERMIKIFDGQLKEKRRTIVALGALLGVTLLIIIAALVIDRLNPDRGFFWMFSNWFSHRFIKV